MSQPYLSLEAELHDAFWDAEDDASEVRLMAGFLKKYPGPSLELGSGSGRLMFPLLELGYDVEGLELSPDMLALGKKRASEMGLVPLVHHGDICKWRGTRRFATLLAPAFILQLAADPEVALRHWRDLLENHGGLYLTVFMPYAELLGDLPENQWYPDHQVTLPSGFVGKLETRHRLDRRRQLLHREHRYTLSGDPPTTHESKQTIRWIEHSEMLSLLKKSGFHLDRFFMDFDPAKTCENPDLTDFDGILTYHVSRDFEK
ncbi:MAG: class I SAM-dependent methyltransferase [Gloeobacteraceae cyanobacterium ES-bin-144]|nr:class I SAM-dependent methyltransferase [Verrucomicrobiales bacterium]